MVGAKLIFKARYDSSKLCLNFLPSRQPLHSVLSAVSFQGLKETFVALAVSPDSETSSTGATGVSDGEEAPSFFAPSAPSSSSSSSDVVFASCLVFQSSSSEVAATFVRDLKDVFVAAMRSKVPARIS